MKAAKDIPPRAATPAVEEAERWAWYPLALIFAVMALGIFAGGAFSYRRYERHFRAGVERELAAIAELKMEQVAHWRHERLVDANLLRGTPYVARRALAVLAQPKSPAARQVFTGWLDSLFSGAPYEQALLLDERLNVRLVYPASAPRALSEATLRAAQQSSRSRRVVVADLHRETEDGPVYLSLMVPLVLQRESDEDKAPAAGTGASSADRGAGLLVLQINAGKEFYPMIQRWPTASRTAETLLVRRDGNDALFLNDLKFRTNAALKLRTPLEENELARGESRAGAGRRGGRDRLSRGAGSGGRARHSGLAVGAGRPHRQGGSVCAVAGAAVDDRPAPGGSAVGRGRGRGSALAAAARPVLPGKGGDSGGAARLTADHRRDSQRAARAGILERQESRLSGVQRGLRARRGICRSEGPPWER